MSDETPLHRTLGLTDFEIGPHIWNRLHIIPILGTEFDGQRDHINLVRTPRFEPAPSIGWEAMRSENVHEMRWWSLDEILDAGTVLFAPRRLAGLFGEFLSSGASAPPIDTGV